MLKICKLFCAGGLQSLVHGWERQFQLLADNVSAALPLHRRVPQLMWRGRVSPERRDELRRQFVECPEVLLKPENTISRL